jgi:hypothetical protein
MAHVLVRLDTPVLERLVVAVAERAGHTAEALPAQPRPAVGGDVLVLDPTAAGGVAWAAAVRPRGTRIVLIGADPQSAAVRRLGPAAIVPLPFDLAELERGLGIG